MSFPRPQYQLPEGNPWKGGGLHGPDQNCRHQKLAIPEKVKDIHSFLGFCNFYHAFIKGFSSIAQPLNALTKKDQTWMWTREHQKAFDILKAHVTSKPILVHPDLDKQFKLEVNTSGFAAGAVLLQKKEDSKQHPVGYYSATLNAAEWNYNIYNLKLLAIVKALKHWQLLLAGSHIKGTLNVHADTLSRRPDYDQGENNNKDV